MTAPVPSRLRLRIEANSRSSHQAGENHRICDGSRASAYPRGSGLRIAVTSTCHAVQ